MSRILSKNECQACFQIALEIFFSPLASHFKLSYLLMLRTQILFLIKNWPKS